MYRHAIYICGEQNMMSFKQKVGDMENILWLNSTTNVKCTW